MFVVDEDATLEMQVKTVKVCSPLDSEGDLADYCLALQTRRDHSKQSGRGRRDTEIHTEPQESSSIDPEWR